MRTTPQRILAITSCSAHLALGLAILFRFGPVASSPAWSVLSEPWSDYGSPLAFILIAALAGFGYVSRRSLQLSLYAGGIVAWLWALALGIAWHLGYGPQPSVLWLFYVGVLKWTVAYFWLALQKQVAVNQEQTAAIDQLSHQVARTIHRSENRLRGDDAGDTGED